MNIVVCFKVVSEEQDITVNADNTLSAQKAEPKISPYDLNAIEAAVQLAVSTGGKVTAVSIGGNKLENGKVRKDVLSRGADALSLVVDDSLADLLPYQSAQVLKAALAKLEYDVVLCGEGSADLYAQQVGVLLGEMQGLPAINAVSKITPEGAKLLVERELETEVEVLEVPTPGVLCVTSDINTPKIPSMKNILAAGKKPVNVIALAELGLDGMAAKAQLESILAPERAERKKVIIEGDSDEAVADFAQHIRKVL